MTPRVTTWLEERRLTALAIGAVAVFACFAAVRAQDILAALYANADAASAFTLAEVMGDRDSARIILGNYAWLEPLYLQHATRWVPAHKQFWELLPVLFFLVALASIWWSTARASGRRVALLVVLALAAPSSFVLGWVATPNARGHSLAHVALLSAFLVSLPSFHTWVPWRRVLWAVALAVSLMPAVASDDLVLVGAGAGFAVAVLAGAAMRLVGWVAASLALAAFAAGALGGRLLITAASDDGVVAAPKRLLLVTSDQLMPHVRLLLESLSLYFHGRIGGELAPQRLAEELVALLVLVGLPILLVAARRPLARLVADADRPAEARLLVLFWGTLAVAVCAAFVVTTAPVDVLTGRYLLTVWPALLIVAALVLPRRAAVASLAVVATGCAALGVAQMSAGEYTSVGAVPHGRHVGDLLKFVEREGLSHGYAGYWEAAPMAMESDFQLPVYPLVPCAPSGDGRCPPDVHIVESWYVPKRGVRTFYVQNAVPIGRALPPPPARWGPPAKQVTIGPMTVSVFDYDIARRLPEGT